MVYTNCDKQYSHHRSLIGFAITWTHLFCNIYETWKSNISVCIYIYVCVCVCVHVYVRACV